MFFALHFHPVAGFSPLPPVLTSSGARLLSPGGFLAQGRVRNQGKRGRRDGEPRGRCQSSGRVAAGSFGLSVVEMRLAECSVSGPRSWKEE